MQKQGKTQKTKRKQGESGKNMKKHEETRETQGKRENAQKDMLIRIYTGDIIWSLT